MITMLMASLVLGCSPPAAASINGFGIELYKALTAGSPNGNLVLSPYSISMALAMTAEGARGETAGQMARVLHAGEDGADARRAIAGLHGSFAELARALTAAQGVGDAAIAARITELRAQLDAANARTRSLEGGSEGWRRAQASQQEAQRLADELNALLASVDRFDLRVANALWVERSYPLAPTYTAELDRHYGSGSANPLDIAADPEAARRRINGWVEDRTERRIRDLIPQGMLAPDARLVITNAIYFRGAWTIPFVEGRTRDEPFTLAGGDTVTVRMMNDAWRAGASYAAFTGSGEYFETPGQVPADESSRPAVYPDEQGFQVLQLPYKGGDLAMVLLLPRRADGLPALESRLDASSLDAWLGRLSMRAVNMGIPRFRLEGEQELSGALTALGMPRAFVNPIEPHGAQFAGMTLGTNPEEQLFIGAVLHKAWIEVAEKGTEAAAATSVMMAPAGAMIEPRTMVPFVPEFRADHPFLFLIRDTKSGAILFMGRVADPS